MGRHNLVRIWTESGEPVTWRHFVLGAVWIITVLPELILVGLSVTFTWLSEATDNLYGRVKKWANPVNHSRIRERIGKS